MSDDSKRASLDFTRDIWTVSRLNRELSAVLQGSFPLLWVEGEVSNLAHPASGHLYFSLKDEAAQVRCVMFRNKRLLANANPANGQRFMVRARVGFYEPRGDCQLIVEHLEPAGEGALRLALEALKRQLAAEGLFDERRKRPLPRFARQIGIITSASGAALHDLLTVLRRRWPLVQVLVYPAQVQGEGAAETLLAAVELANSRNECDLLILARGGGSFEDLMAFNDERLARAVRASAIPLLTGIGHEVDLSIADLAADQRAATPSAAAECATPAQQAMRDQLRALEQRLIVASRSRLRQAQRAFVSAERHLQLLHPHAQLQQKAQTLDRLEERLARSIQRHVERRGEAWRARHRRLLHNSPLESIQAAQRSNQRAAAGLMAAEQRLLERLGHRLAQAAAALEGLSPLATLARGYAIVLRADGTVVRQCAQTRPGDRLAVRLSDGQLTVQVQENQRPR